jgi:hypothetical protein
MQAQMQTQIKARADIAFSLLVLINGVLASQTQHTPRRTLSPAQRTTRYSTTSLWRLAAAIIKAVRPPFSFSSTFTPLPCAKTAGGERQWVMETYVHLILAVHIKDEWPHPEGTSICVHKMCVVSWFEVVFYVHGGSVFRA